MADEGDEILMVPDSEGTMHLVKHEVLMDDAGMEVLAMGSALHKFIREHGGVFTIAHDPEMSGGAEWSTMLNFGRESEDSPMAAGSALGTGATANEAIKAMLDEAGIKYEVPE